MTQLPSFHDFFTTLWGVDPFPWQTMLTERIGADAWPHALDLPTASGKTACVDVAIWTLAEQAERLLSQRTAPRRIWFVVDRRIVVDEAHSRAITIASKLDGATNGPLKAVADRLREIGGTRRPLAVGRLRGGVLRDDGWARLPSQRRLSRPRPACESKRPRESPAIGPCDSAGRSVGAKRPGSRPP